MPSQDVPCVCKRGRAPGSSDIVELALDLRELLLHAHLLRDDLSQLVIVTTRAAAARRAPPRRARRRGGRSRSHAARDGDVGRLGARALAEVAARARRKSL